jgi:hypothetical protein
VTEPGGPSVSISPEPDDLEAAAIVAAYEALWPRPVVAGSNRAARTTAAWRFSGRWWAAPLPIRRARPR